MDKHRWDPQGFDDDTVNGADVDAVRAVDRMLDAIAAGGRLEGEAGTDPLYRLLADARAETDRDMPDAPSVGPVDTQDGAAPVVPLSGHRRRRAVRRAGGVAALGGVSLTSLVVGSGVAAALVVGGFTVNALIPGGSGGSGGSDSIVAESGQQSGEGAADSSARRGDADPERETSRASDGGAPSESDTESVDRGGDAGGMVLADPQPGSGAESAEPTDTTGDGGAAVDEGESAGDAEASEAPVETAVPGGPMVMAEPQRGAAAPAKTPSSTSSTSSTTPSSSPKAQREGDDADSPAEPTPGQAR
ncbi:hypothetical protein [Corynebacterium sp.]|uniref:hypothetical protein n=1 Tax=Corynebacterium sp. TaxID=1720 RepID=UPI003B3A32E8